jgi:hypothetical protein
VEPGLQLLPKVAEVPEVLLTISRIVAWVVDPMRPSDGACPVTMDGVARTEWEAGTAEEVRELVLARLRSERDPTDMSAQA